MNKHTPGPWEAHYSGAKDRWEIGNYKTHNPHAFVPDLQRVKKLEPCEAEANAALIAACPDMYEALLWITRCAKAKGPAGTTVYFISDEKMAAAKAAIAQAEGRG